MYLKEIKMSGFKSFADKININLDDDITCIVGPNGSGKSNIVDAIKWVLGEQSVKTLRGSNNMADVIFSGSSSRNPLNVASVSIVFDNSDSYLKVPYTEISVTRKVYRNGENEYFLNNEKCRLKDISDLFLDSGMGKYAFNIISQGEVSKIISDSPVERRAIFEEAAGVLKYKKRKEEALKRLEKTNDNLTRVNDITKELEIQVEPLKEQSLKAKEYLKAKEQLEGIEIALIASDLEKLDVSYKDVEKQIEYLENEIVAIATNTTNSDISLEMKKQELVQINEKIVELNNRLLVLTKEEEKLNGEKNIIKERSKYNATDVKVHENIASLKEQKHILNNRLLSIKTDIGILNTKKQDFISWISEETKKLKQIQDERNNLDLTVLKKSKEITDLTYKIKTLYEYIENGGSTSPSVKKVLSNPKLKGLHKTISALVDIDEKYNLALEVALGGAKDYVVVDNTNVAKNCINYLKENNLGRVTFYPLDVIKSRNVDEETLKNIQKEEGFINILANLASYDAIYKDVVYNQLGNVILVDTIDNANYISKLINNRYKIVTLTGEIINVGGSITGGTLKRNSIISEKYELQRLEEQKYAIELELKQQEEKVESLTKQEKEKQFVIITKEKEKIILNEEIKNKESSYDMTLKDYDKITLELDNLEDLVNDTLEDEEERVINKYYQVLNEKEVVGKDLKQVSLIKEKVESIIEELETSFRLNNNLVREKENELKQLEIQKAKMSSKMDGLLNSLSESYSMTFEKAKANYILEIDDNVARKTVNELRNELRKIGVVNLGAIEEYERVSTRYNFLKKQSEDLENAISTLLHIIEELDLVMEQEFIKTFKEVEIEFNNVFKELFGGGSAALKLTDKDNILQTGIDIIVTPPGKKVSTISLLSGGEKTLAAISLLFAILNIKKIPFCIFDEVEAALDEANVDKVGTYFKKYVDKTQLIIITHKKKTMEYANTLYGITMQESGVSKLVSVKLVD